MKELLFNESQSNEHRKVLLTKAIIEGPVVGKHREREIYFNHETMNYRKSSPRLLLQKILGPL